MFACEQEAGHARSALPGQGPDRRLPAAGRHAGDRRNLAGLSGHVRRERRRSFTATPTAAIRWARPRRWPRSTCSRKNRRSRNLPPKIARLARASGPHRRAPARRRRAAVRPDRRASNWCATARRKSRIPGKRNAGLRVCDVGPRPGRAAAPAGQRARRSCRRCRSRSTSWTASSLAVEAGIVEVTER